MANTKVTGDLIASSTIATGNIADNAVTSDKISGITTAHITEGSNLYYTDARADARITAATTSDLTEGTNLYYTNARTDARVNLQTGANLSLSNKSTSDLSEGTNLYYTDARADARAALLVDSAPSTLDTLNELAAALGDDPNFATTTATSIGLKAPLASPGFTGIPSFSLNDGTFIKAVNATNNVASTNVWGYGLYEGGSKIAEISLVRDGSINQTYIGTTTANQTLRIGTANKVTALTINASQNATFAGNITTTGNINAGSAKYLRFTSAASNSDAAVLFGNTSGAGGSLTFKRNSDSAAILTLNGDKNATFSGNISLSANKYILIGTDSGDAFNSDSAIRIQDTGNAYVQIKTGTGNQGGVLIGDDDDDYVGGFIYSNSSNTLTFQQNNAAALTISGSGNATFAGIVGMGSTGIYAGTAAQLNLPGRGLAIKNDKNGSNNNWSYIENTATGSASNINFYTGNNAAALTLAHNGDATFAAQVKTNVGTAISYAAGDEIVAAHEHEEIQVDSDNQYKRMGAITVSKSGTISVKWEGYIVSGTYYWGWAIARNNGTTVSAVTPSNILKSGGYGTAYPNGLASGVTASVHAMRQYDVDIADVIPGDQIELWMRSSAGSGAQVTGNGQQLRAKKFRISSTTPTVESNAYFHGTTTITDVAGDERYGGESWSKYLTFDAADSGGGGMVWSKQASTWNRGILSNHGDLQLVRSSDDGNSGSIVKDLIISNTGYVTKPGQPAFKAGRSGNISTSGGATIIFNDTGGSHFNQGNHYNTTNGRFTAPVAGTYIFSAVVIFMNIADGFGMDDAFYIYKNTINVAYSFKRAEYVSGTTGNGGYYVDHANVMLQLAANDYVHIRNKTTLTVHGNTNYTFFYGYLLG